MIANGEAFKVCCGCGNTLPLSHFQAKQARCRICRTQYVREYRRALRCKQVRQFKADVRRAASLQGALMLIDEMAVHFGGASGLAQAWANDIRAARPGSRECLGSYRAIVHLGTILESARPSDDAAQLTDDELQHELLGLLAEAVE